MKNVGLAVAIAYALGISSKILYDEKYNPVAQFELGNGTKVSCRYPYLQNDDFYFYYSSGSQRWIREEKGASPHPNRIKGKLIKKIPSYFFAASKPFEFEAALFLMRGSFSNHTKRKTTFRGWFFLLRLPRFPACK